MNKISEISNLRFQISDEISDYRSEISDNVSSQIPKLADLKLADLNLTT